MRKILTATPKATLAATLAASLAATLAASLIPASVGLAGTVTTNMPISATVASTCSATAPTLAFGTYTPGGGYLTGSSAIAVKCTKSSTFTVALNGGSTSGGTIGQRLMANGANTLQYNLYTAATTTGTGTIFGDGVTSGSATMPGTGAGLATAVTITAYGYLPDNATNQGVVPGSYTDTVQVTITY
jgi:spore coat protein U-like protein